MNLKKILKKGNFIELKNGNKGMIKNIIPIGDLFLDVRFVTLKDGFYTKTLVNSNLICSCDSESIKKVSKDKEFKKIVYLAE